MIPLFVLRNVAAVNFYLYAQDFPTAGRGSAVFLGANSSGKSVLLDAIQIVMTGMNKRFLDLNSRVSEGGRTTRTVREACLGLLDDGAGYEREACLTYIALGFEAEDGSRRCTAGVCLEAKASLSEENVLGLFIVEDAILRFEDFVNPQKGGFEEKTWQSFLDERRRNGQTIHTFQRQSNRAFLRHLYAIVNANTRGTQLDPDRARAAMRQALSFDIGQIKSVIRTGDLAASEDGKYAHGRGIEYRRLQQIPRLGKSVRERQIAQLTQQQRDLSAKLHPAREAEARLAAVLRALKQAATVLVADKAETVGTLEQIEAADAESKRQAELIADLEAKLPDGVIKEKRDAESMLATYRRERDEEREKERGLIGKIAQRSEAMNSNTGARNNAAAAAREAFPVWERRFCRHKSPIGLERFIRRARAAYAEQRAALGHPSHVRNHFDALLKNRRPGPRSADSRLMIAIQDYVQSNPDQHPRFEWGQIIESERTEVYDWINLRHRHLKEAVLRNFKEQVDKAVLALVETMVHDFLSRLRANIDGVERTKEDLNGALRDSVFMDEVYQIRQERDQDKETIRYLIDRLDIVAPKATALMQSTPDPNDSDQVKIKELIDMLTFEENEDAAHRRRLHELSDYRNYFRFSIDICDPAHGYRKISDLDQRRGKASGGQKFVPFYICLGVAAASAYHNHLGSGKDAPPQSALLLMDEAFEKLDPDNIYKVIQFYNRLGLQLIMAAPKTHQALYQETFDTLISIIRVGRAIQATAQHFHAPAHELLHRENPMHKPRSFFEERARWEGKDAAE